MAMSRSFLSSSSSLSSQRVVPITVRHRNRFISSTSASLTPHVQQRDDDNNDNGNCNFLLILGKPGGGKGTISKKILRDFPQLHHISTGDLLRQHVRESTDLGRLAKSYMDQGDLVPDQVMIDLVMSDATPQLEQGQSLLLDGFPRTQKQAQSLDEVVGVDLVINLDIPTETIVERIAHRWIHPASGRVYNLEYNPPKVPGLDNETGEPLVQRDDDKPESVRARLKLYETVTAPLVSYYESKGGGRGRGGGGVLKTFTGTQSDVIYPRVKEWLMMMMMTTTTTATTTTTQTQKATGSSKL